MFLLFADCAPSISFVRFCTFMMRVPLGQRLIFFSVKLCAFSLLCSLFLAFWGLVICFYSDFSSWGHKSHMGNITLLQTNMWYCPEIPDVQQEVLFSLLLRSPGREVSIPMATYTSWGTDFSSPHFIEGSKLGQSQPDERILVKNLHLVQVQHNLSCPCVWIKIPVPGHNGWVLFC